MNSLLLAEESALESSQPLVRWAMSRVPICTFSNGALTVVRFGKDGRYVPITLTKTKLFNPIYNTMGDDIFHIQYRRDPDELSLWFRYANGFSAHICSQSEDITAQFDIGIWRYVDRFDYPIQFKAQVDSALDEAIKSWELTEC